MTPTTEHDTRNGRAEPELERPNSKRRTIQSELRGLHGVTRANVCIVDGVIHANVVGGSAEEADEVLRRSRDAEAPRSSLIHTRDP